MEPETAASLLWDERRRLEAVREESSLIDGATSDEINDADQHMADLGTETASRTADLAILNQVEAELSEVEAALERLEAGTYGKCEVDGSPIPDERLQALPTTRYCVDHAATRPA